MMLEPWKFDFIEHLKRGGDANTGARMIAGAKLSDVQKAREDDPEFARAWDEAAGVLGARVDVRALTPGALEALLWSQCTDEETAAYFGFTVGEFKSRVTADKELSRVYDLARDGGKAALKQAQFEAAMSGEKTMLTWLGKQHLGQSEKSEVTTKVDLESMSLEELARRMAFIAAFGQKRGVKDGGSVTDAPLEAIEVQAESVESV